MWNLFLKYGDKVFAGLATAAGILNYMGVLKSPVYTEVLAALTFIHNTFLPEPTTPAVTLQQAK